VLFMYFLYHNVPLCMSVRPSIHPSIDVLSFKLLNIV
jgi:hypothetical protein